MPLEKAWEIAGNFTKSPGSSISVVVEKEGDPKFYGAGAERTVTIGKVRVYERLETIDPPYYFTYKIVSGAPIKNYLGRVEFIPEGNETVIKWTATFTPKIPGTAWMVGKVIRDVINSFINEIGRIR